MSTPPSQPRRRPLFVTRVTLAVLSVVLVVLVAALVLKTRTDDGAAAAAARQYSAPAFSAPVKVDQVVSVVGDGLAGPTPKESAADAWPAIMAKDPGLLPFVAVTRGGGYVTVGQPDTVTFVALASQVAPGARVVVLIGGASDSGADEFLRLQDIAEALAEVRRIAPNAKIVVVGPVYDGNAAQTPSSLLGVRNDIRVVVKAQQSVFVDPIHDDWAPAGSKVLTSDGTTWTAAGQRMVAERLEPVIAPLVRGD